jgi:uncharacterized protein (TIRG00374 family)
MLAIALLWWFGRKLDWMEVSQALRQANWYLLSLAVGIICLAYLLRAVRWGALLAPLGRARLADLFAATTLGFSAVFLIGRAGEVVRPAALTMRDPRVRPTSSFVTIFIERIYDMMAVLVLFSVNLLWFSPPSITAGEFWRVRMSGLFLLAIAMCGIAALVFFRRHSRVLIEWLKRFFERTALVPAGIGRAVISLLQQLAGSLRVLVDARELAETVGWTALVWLSIGVASLLVFRAFGLPFGPSEAIFVLGWSLAGSLVPTPGGAAGAFHAATAAGLLFLGITRETAAAVSIVFHVIAFGPALLFGFFYFVRGDISISRIRALLKTEPSAPSIDNTSPARRLLNQASALGPD